jgi:hypothetical protein
MSTTGSLYTKLLQWEPAVTVKLHGTRRYKVYFKELILAPRGFWDLAHTSLEIHYYRYLLSFILISDQCYELKKENFYIDKKL